MLLLSGCGGDSAGPPQPAPVALVVVQPDSTTLTIGATLQLSATLRDAAGQVLTGRLITWSSSDISRASVSTNGLVSAAATGRVVITATSEGRSGSAVIQVDAGARDFGIVTAQFTQGVQSASGSIPMVLDGNAAVVNVLISATPPQATPMQVVLRLFDAATQALVRADTALTSGTLDGAPSYLTPSVQFLVPASVLRRGLEWQVVRDPRRLVSDDSTANDVFPRERRLPLATVDVPALELRFVPIVLAAHNNATGAVSEGTLPEYLRTLRSIHPVGRIEARVGASYTTNASFGTPPQGGDQAFWVQVLNELDIARLLDPNDADAHWYGVVRPPTGFNFTRFGGFAYIPSSGTSAGARTRTGVGVQVGWFNNPTQARDLVAHELGHNFGRLHSPCGGAGAPLDGGYPVASGFLDQPGHDVFSWAMLGTGFAATIAATTGDVMGYCFPVWSSTYTYEAILQFRAPLAEPPPVTRVLVVRGSIDGAGVRLEPAFTVAARPSLPERPGDHVLEGLTAEGRVLFSYGLEPARLDHAPDLRPFTVALPTSPEIEEALHTLRVRGPAGEAQLARPDVASARPRGAMLEAAAISSAAHGMTRVTCHSPGSRGILVQHGSSGSLLGTANAASLLVAAEPGTPLLIACSDGVRTGRSTGVVP